MSEGLFNLPFGLNVRVPTRTLQEAQKTWETQVSNLWTPVFDFFEENEKVFNGEVSQLIDVYNRQTYNLGAMMREAAGERPSFDTKG